MYIPIKQKSLNKKTTKASQGKVIVDGIIKQHLKDQLLLIVTYHLLFCISMSDLRINLGKIALTFPEICQNSAHTPSILKVNTHYQPYLFGKISHTSPLFFFFIKLHTISQFLLMESMI
jgi:hypothetical protein